MRAGKREPLAAPPRSAEFRSSCLPSFLPPPVAATGTLDWGCQGTFQTFVVYMPRITTDLPQAAPSAAPPQAIKCHYRHDWKTTDSRRHSDRRPMHRAKRRGRSRGKQLSQKPQAVAQKPKDKEHCPAKRRGERRTLKDGRGKGRGMLLVQRQRQVLQMPRHQAMQLLRRHGESVGGTPMPPPSPPACGISLSTCRGEGARGRAFRAG